MAIIEQLQRQIEMLENQLREERLQTQTLLAKAQKVLDVALHAYKVDHYGFIWVYQYEAKEYVRTDMRVMSPQLVDEAVKTRHLADSAVTEAKIADGAVTNDKIAPKAVTSSKLADESITGDEMVDEVVKAGKIATDAVQTRNIKDQNVTNGKIKDHDLSWEKLDTALQNLIASAGAHGVALANEWGDSILIGLSQKMLSEALGEVHKEGEDFISLQQQIDQIVNDKATVNLDATPSPIFVGVQRDITLTATTNTQATSIQIKKGSTVLATGSGLTLGGTDTITPSAAGNTTYTALFTIAGLQKTATKNVVAVYPIYYGALETYNSENLTQLNTPSTTVKGTYSIELDTTPKKIYFKVPKGNVTGVSKVELLSDGNYSPVGGSVDASLGDENYNVWVSDDAYNVEIAGNRSFVVNR